MPKSTKEVALTKMISTNNATAKKSGELATVTALAFAICYGSGTDVEKASKASGKELRQKAQKAYPDYKEKPSTDKSLYSGLSIRISWCNRILNHHSFEGSTSAILSSWGDSKDFKGMKLEALYKSTLKSAGTAKNNIEKFVDAALKISDGDFTPIFNALRGSEVFRADAERLNNFYNGPDFKLDFSTEELEIGSEV